MPILGSIGGMSARGFGIAVAQKSLVPIVTDLGGISNSTSLTIGPAGVPAGTLIVVSASIGKATSCSDSSGNTYHLAIQIQVAAGDWLNVFYSYNSTALVNGNTITVPGSGSGGVIDALYATNILATSDPLDSSVTATYSAGNTSPHTLTSGTPSQSGELFVAIVQADNTSFTQDTGNGWSAPPDYVQYTTINNMAGGYQINTGLGTKQFNYSIDPNYNLNMAILGFKHA